MFGHFSLKEQLISATMSLSPHSYYRLRKVHIYTEQHLLGLHWHGQRLLADVLEVTWDFTQIMEQCIVIFYHKCGFTERQRCVLNVFGEMMKAFGLVCLGEETISCGTTIRYRRQKIFNFYLLLVLRSYQ